MKERTVTGHWGHETISRPKTLGERHTEMNKPKHQALKAVPRIKGSAAWNRYYHPEKVHAEAETSRRKMFAHMKALSKKEPTEQEKRSYQNKTGRGYNE